MPTQRYPLLDNVNNPNDLKRLNIRQLPALCAELRNFIISEVSENPGHVGASLGVVELSVALHFAFNTPYDKLVWDVGHQAYAHKILTGRRHQFATNRMYGGLSGFPNITESEYDAFGTGHSSTSISAALGMAIAAKMQGESRQVVAIIGDGSMGGGMAFEGMNNAGVEKSNLLVILNDNNMAISPNVGALGQYLTEITTSQMYNRVRDKLWRETERRRYLRTFLKKTAMAFKMPLLRHSNLFEALHFRYFGPIDGHDVDTLVRTLNKLKNIPGPKLLHVLTVKGKGFAPAEQNQALWHAPGKFDPLTGERIPSPHNASRPLYQQVFGETMIELAKRNRNIVAITPAMLIGSGLEAMKQLMPERVFDVGIAEQHAVTFAAGLAAAGKVPYCSIYSTFLQRAYDSVIHDVALQGLQVVLCVDRAGLVGEDGATHHGAFDIAYLRCIPNLVVAAPMNESELRNMLYTAQLPNGGAFAVRYPRGRALHERWRMPFEAVPVGKARQLRQGSHVAVLSLGHVGNFVGKAADVLQIDGISIAHYDMRFAKPIDEDVLHEVGRLFERVLTVEDGAITGGMGSAVAEFFTSNGYNVRLMRLGIPDRFISHGSIEQLQAECGFSIEGIEVAVRKLMIESEAEL